MKTSQAVEVSQSRLCYRCLCILSLTRQEEKEDEKNALPMPSQQFILCTLYLYSAFKAGDGERAGGTLMPQNSWLKLLQALHPSSQQGRCTVYLSEADLGCHWAQAVWMWFGVEREQEPAWHSWLLQRLFCKQRGPSPFLIYALCSWVLQQDQEYTIIKHPLGCLAHRQRRMSWYSFVSLRRSYPPERRDEAGLRRRCRQEEGGRQSATEEKQV